MSKIAASPISILKITGSLKKSGSKKSKTDNNKVVRGGGGGKIDEIVVDLSKFKKLKNNKSENSTCIRAIRELIFLIFDIKNAYNWLNQVFIKVLILKYFNIKHYI